MKAARFETILGEPFYRIPQAENLSEFFMTLVSSGEHWMFISSSGALTAGRRNPEGALFPYETVDKIMASRGTTGTRTIIRVDHQGSNRAWEPFADWSRSVWKIERSIAKNREGNRLVFEETNVDLGISFAWSWSFSRQHGFVRRAWLTNLGSQARELQIVDGFLNLLNSGITRSLQTGMSCLTDAYKDNVLDPASGLAAFGLASIITDKAEPREGLRATVAWQTGLDQARISLCRESLDKFLTGQLPAGDATPFPTRVCGKKSDFLLHAGLTLDAGATKAWYTVAELGMDHLRVAGLRAELLAAPASLPERLETEIAAVKHELRRMIAASDGLSASALPMHEWHHSANVLYNIMRGGLPADGYTVQGGDFIIFVGQRNHAAQAKAAELLQGTTTLSHAELLETMDKSDLPVLGRLAHEYLPLMFSRRHGDPSRPWNEFAIRLTEPDGRPRLDYQGNWRDIFQNWEALGLSFPAYLESFISVFLNATSPDGYNPYRVSRSGIDWEKVEPDNPWSNIGYWNDHQIIYFQKLAETLHASQPERLPELLGKRSHAYANIPYRIADFAATCRNPRSTITFDHGLHDQIDKRVEEMGGDGRLVTVAGGGIYHGTMLEKLLTLFLAKLGNLVPEGGIWLNTQRPEWNDANNALAGWGLSMVTVMQLRRFAAFWQARFAETRVSRVGIASGVAKLMEGQAKVLASFAKQAKLGFDDKTRFDFMAAMGKELDAYKAWCYGPGVFTQETQVETARVRDLFTRAIEILDASIKASRRPDGMFESYNRLELGAGTATVQKLYPMLEGQVAVLSSGYLDPAAGLELIQNLRKGPLWREDQHSYLLYPRRVLPDFYTKNSFAPGSLGDTPLVKKLLADAASGIIALDCDGSCHFGASIENQDELLSALDALALRPEWRELVTAHRQALTASYEAIFGHGSFTGRSGAMYAYEGLGSIYWHMVSKLLLAALELHQAACDANAPEPVRTGLDSAYYDIREGLGYRKDAMEWGAFPWDPYSHTPFHAKAQQPGMTGQVKEELLSRLGEFGLRLDNGQIKADTHRFLAGEYLTTAATFDYLDVNGREANLDLPAGSAACTLCQVPFVVMEAKAANKASLEVHMSNGKIERYQDSLPADISKAIFGRTGQVRQVVIKG